MKRLNKEYSIDINPSFKTKYGSTNHKKPEVIYIVGNTYISPSFDSSDYVSEVDELKSSYNKLVNELISEYSSIFDKNCIFDIDVCDNRIKKGKKTFLTFELYLKQKDCKQLSEIESIIKNISTNLTHNFKEKLNTKNFLCFKNKKS